jgi:hypothetical protein
MLHLLRRRQRSLICLCALVVLIGLSAPAARGAVAPTVIGITANPSMLAVSVPLGQSARRTITVTNTSGAPLTPVLYEAYPEPPATSMRGTIAPDLRAAALPRQAQRLDPELLSSFAASPGGTTPIIL